MTGLITLISGTILVAMFLTRTRENAQANDAIAGVMLWVFMISASCWFMLHGAPDPLGPY